MGDKVNKVTLGFTGDFSFSGYFDGCYTREDLIDEKILAFLNENDANIVNFESPITPCKVSNRKKKLIHRSDPAAVGYVEKNIYIKIIFVHLHFKQSLNEKNKLKSLFINSSLLQIIPS